MTIYGWDMSHYDAPSIGSAVSQGISFITHKAGGDATDAELDNWWTGVRNLPESVVLGAYWVQYPGNPAGRADSFLARLDAACPGWRDRDSFILQIDAEIWGGNAGTKPSLVEINAFGDRLVSRTGGKYRPVAYAPKWVYPNVAGLRYPVWASSYVTGSGGFKALYPGDGSSRWNAYGGPVSILQYSSSATIGGQTTSDANAFKGTVDQLKALVTPGRDIEEVDMPLSGADENFLQDAILNYTEGGLPTFLGPAGTKNLLNYLSNMATEVHGQQAAIAQLVTLVTAQSAATAAEIAEALAPLILAGIPDTDLTADDVEAAVKSALREGTETP
jgi:hypothetical protein